MKGAASNDGGADTRRSLKSLFDPRSVAVVGASDEITKWGHRVAKSALSGSDRREVYLVNHKARHVLGRPAFPSLLEVPEPPELVVVAVPASGFEAVVDSALAVGARAIVGITSGFGESDEAGQERQRRLAERVRAAGAVLVGPNCAGLADSASALHLEWESFAPGNLALVSQSGNLISEIAVLGAEVGVGFSRYVSVGNQADLEVADFLDDLADHAETRVVACYVEDFRDGRRFIRAARRCVASGKPVILLTAGRSAAGERIARSHTGALTSEAAVVRTAGQAAGAHVVSTPGELVDLAQLWSLVSARGGPRVAVVGDGGGACAIASDTLAAFGLDVPVFSDALQRRLAAELPATASTTNPVDLSGAGERDRGIYERIVAHLLETDESDAVLVTGYFGGYSNLDAKLRDPEVAVARLLAGHARGSHKVVVAHLDFSGSPVAIALREGGVPVYQRIEMAARALSALAGSSGPPVRPGQAPAAAREGKTSGAQVASAQAASPQASVAQAGSYFAARRLLAEAGIGLMAATEVTSREDARSAAAAIGYPVALKAVSLEHKSDSGGVALGLARDEDLVSAFEDMQRRLSPPSFSVEQMAPVADGLELIVGGRRDRSFGPVVMIGAGGLYAELFAQVELALAPATTTELRALLLRLPFAGLLTGTRGRPPLDVGAVAEAAAGLSRLLAERPDIAELEANPLLALTSGAVALDARVVMAENPLAIEGGETNGHAAV